MKTLQKRKFTFSDYWDKYSTITILVIMIAVFGALRPSSFLTGSNLIKIMEQSAILPFCWAWASSSPFCWAASI